MRIYLRALSSVTLCVVLPSSRGCSRPRDLTCISSRTSPALSGRFFTTGVPPGKCTVLLRILAFSSVFLQCLCLALCQDDSGLIKWIWECSFFFSVLEEFKKDWYEFLFERLVELTHKTIWSRDFILFIYFIFFLRSFWLLLQSPYLYSSVQVFIFSWFNIGRLYVSRNLHI